MRETIEFRIGEKDARKHLDPELGVLLGDSIRKVVLPVDDERVQRIAEIERAYRKRGDCFFTSWHVQRRYTQKELQSAELLNLVIRTSFEPPGSMCGTEYDDSTACRHCGAGARQTTVLILDTRRISRNKDIAQSIAGEIIVSSRFAAAFRKHGLRGADFRPVLHPSRNGPQPSDWFQPVFTSKPLKLSKLTVAGNNPFDLDVRNEHRCPKGHVVGLNALSELYVERASYDGSDLCITDKLFGERRGELRPEPRLLISSKLREVLEGMDAKGYVLEVAHFV